MTTRHTDELRPEATLAARMAAAYRDGRATAQGRELRRCPWNGASSDAGVRVLAKMWARGYSAGNPIRLP